AYAAANDKAKDVIGDYLAYGNFKTPATDYLVGKLNETFKTKHLTPAHPGLLPLLEKIDMPAAKKFETRLAEAKQWARIERGLSVVGAVILFLGRFILLAGAGALVVRYLLLKMDDRDRAL